MKAIAKAALGRLVRLFPPTETLDGFENADFIEAIFRKAAAFIPSGEWVEFKNRRVVLDFGGGFGQHFKCALTQSPKVRWAIVETAAVVERATVLASPQLQFFSSIAAALDWLGMPDAVYSNGALQYTPDPNAVANELCSIGAPEMLWERTVLSQTNETEIDEQLSRLDENGPRGSIRDVTISRKLVRFKRTKLPETAFLKYHEGYTLIDRGPEYFRFVR